MNNIGPLVFFFVIWISGLILLFIGYRSRLGKKYSEKEFLLSQPKQEIEEVPSWFNIYMTLWVICFTVTSTLIIVFCPIVAIVFQKVYFTFHTDRLFLENTLAMFLFFATSPFLILLIMLIMNQLFLMFFPRIERYVSAKGYIFQYASGLSPTAIPDTYARIPSAEKKRIMTEILQKVDLVKVARSQWRMLFAFGLVIWGISMPVCALTMDYYHIVTDNGFIVNSYLSVIEKQYSWSDVASVRAYVFVRRENQVSIEDLEPRLEVVYNDGKMIDFWDKTNKADQLISLLYRLKSNGIKINLTPLTEKQRDYITKHLSTDVGKVIDYIESITESN